MADLQMETSTVLSIHQGCSFYDECRFVAAENYWLSQLYLDTSSSGFGIDSFDIEQRQWRAWSEVLSAQHHFAAQFAPPW